MLRFALVLVASVGAILSLAAPLIGQTPSPYAGQQDRAIKALSPEEMRDLAEGRGMGLAKAAELNGFPGPSHVLELAGELHLTANQRAATEALYQRMLTDAKRLGTAILEGERDLDRRFAERRIDPASLRQATTALATLGGELRAVHLVAHLEQVALLTPAQVAEYQKHRGYDSLPGHGGHGSRH
jgi:Spy/CpxP family protein refolding chaperone